MTRKNIQLAVGIKHHKIQQIKTRNNGTKSYLDFEKATTTSLLSVLREITDYKFWLDNRAATRDELLFVVQTDYPHLAVNLI